MAPHPKGVRPWKGGWQAYVRVQGTLYQKSYPIGTGLEVMKTWRRTIQSAAPVRTPDGPTFEQDVDAYLKRITAMPTYGQRRQHLDLWLAALGKDRRRATVTTAEIEEIMQGWLTANLEADTVRKRRTSLLALFHKLDGKAAKNPVREAVPPKAKRPEVRGLDYPTLLRILDSMPSSKTQARLRVIAWTGLPPSMLMAVRAHDVNLETAELRVMARKKGGGSAARTLPLVPQAVEAFKLLLVRKALGKFGIAPAGRSLHRACKRCRVSPIRLYDLRHSFGAMLYRTTKDLPTVSRFLLHASLASTARYAAAAVGDVDRAAAKLVGESAPEVVP